MDILCSIKNIYLEKILDKSKIYEFRNVLPNNLTIGDKVYFYETGFKKGRKKVIGSAIVADIKKIKDKKDNSLLGHYPFLLYFAENVFVFESDADELMVINNIKKIYAEDIAIHMQPLVTQYLFHTPYLESMISDRSYFPPPLYSSTNTKKRYKAQMFKKACDNWLDNMGYFEKAWNNCIRLENVIEFSEPKSLSSFLNIKNKPIIFPPQSWLYITGCN